jgi:hypothetical protein
MHEALGSWHSIVSRGRKGEIEGGKGEGGKCPLS